MSFETAPAVGRVCGQAGPPSPNQKPGTFMEDLSLKDILVLTAVLVWLALLYLASLKPTACFVRLLERRSILTPVVATPGHGAHANPSESNSPRPQLSAEGS